MDNKKTTPKIKQIRRNKSEVKKGVNTIKYCGTIRLKEDPLLIQKALRDEWR